MKSLNEKICVKTWQLVALLGTSGFAVGSIASRTASALGF